MHTEKTNKKTAGDILEDRTAQEMAHAAAVAIEVATIRRSAAHMSVLYGLDARKMKQSDWRDLVIDTAFSAFPDGQPLGPKAGR